MSGRKVDVRGILERAGADAHAPEGSQGWALVQVDRVVADLVEKASALHSAHKAFQDWKAGAPKDCPAPRSILEMNVHAKAMLFAALANIGPTP